MSKEFQLLTLFLVWVAVAILIAFLAMEVYEALGILAVPGIFVALLSFIKLDSRS